MKKGAGKAKGSAFEREVAKALSLWITDGKDSKQLIRSVLSGGWQGAQQKDGWRQVGDLAPNGPAGEKFRSLYAVECKHRRGIDLYSLWTRQATEATIEGWWNKLKHDSEQARVYPMLIFKGNSRPTMVGMIQHPPLEIKYAAFDWLGLKIFQFEDMLKIPPKYFGIAIPED